MMKNRPVKKTPILKPGDKVDIFYDPVCRGHIEGTAHLVRFLGVEGFVHRSPVEKWIVRFLGKAGEEKERSILGDKYAVKPERRV